MVGFPAGSRLIGAGRTFGPPEIFPNCLQPKAMTAFILSPRPCGERDRERGDYSFKTNPDPFRSDITVK